MTWIPASPSYIFLGWGRQVPTFLPAFLLSISPKASQKHGQIWPASPCCSPLLSLFSLPSPSSRRNQLSVNDDQHHLIVSLFSKLIYMHLLPIIWSNNYKLFLFPQQLGQMDLGPSVIYTSVSLALNYKFHHLYENGKWKAKQSR